jgi:hypothetical protein
MRSTFRSSGGVFSPRSRMTKSASRRARKAKEKLAARLGRESVVMEFNYPAGVLQARGPIIVTDIVVTDSHAEALRVAGEPIPQKVKCRFLIDTGADGTVVKHEIAERAGLKLINANTPLHGVGIDTTGRSYMGRILFGIRSAIAEGAVHTVSVDTQVMSATLNTDQIDGLIGRDVLRHFELSYDGQSGQVRMKYHRPQKA